MNDVIYEYGCEITSTSLCPLREQIRGEAIDEVKYNVVLFREIFLEELERQAVDREEILMYRNICSTAWNKYWEQLKEKNK